LAKGKKSEGQSMAESKAGEFLICELRFKAKSASQFLSSIQSIKAVKQTVISQQT